MPNRNPTVELLVYEPVDAAKRTVLSPFWELSQVVWLMTPIDVTTYAADTIDVV